MYLLQMRKQKEVIRKTTLKATIYLLSYFDNYTDSEGSDLGHKLSSGAKLNERTVKQLKWKQRKYGDHANDEVFFKMAF